MNDDDCGEDAVEHDDDDDEEEEEEDEEDDDDDDEILDDDGEQEEYTLQSVSNLSSPRMIPGLLCESKRPEAQRLSLFTGSDRNGSPEVPRSASQTPSRSCSAISYRVLSIRPSVSIIFN